VTLVFEEELVLDDLYQLPKGQGRDPHRRGAGPLTFYISTAFLSEKSNPITVLLTYLVLLRQLLKNLRNRMICYLEKWGEKVGVILFEPDHLRNYRRNFIEISWLNVGFHCSSNSEHR
jgi:hypothetical protein